MTFISNGGVDGNIPSRNEGFVASRHHGSKSPFPYIRPISLPAEKRTCVPASSGATWIEIPFQRKGTMAVYDRNTTRPLTGRVRYRVIPSVTDIRAGLACFQECPLNPPTPTTPPAPGLPLRKYCPA